jgi:hypothetical protein
MAEKRSTPVKVPESEVARQATDALGGYVYQLDHTVLTWLTLGDGEVLSLPKIWPLSVEHRTVGGLGRHRRP